MVGREKKRQILRRGGSERVRLATSSSGGSTAASHGSLAVNELMVPLQDRERNLNIFSVSTPQSHAASLTTVTNDAARVPKTGRRRRDSDPALFDEGQDGMDLDADFIAKYDNAMKLGGNTRTEVEIKDEQEDLPTSSYASAALGGRAFFQHMNETRVGVSAPAFHSAEVFRATNAKSTMTTIGRDASAPKMSKKPQGRKNSKTPAGRQPNGVRKKRKDLRFEDDIDKGFSITGYRHWNVKKFNEHWEDFLPDYYKYRKDSE